MQLEEVEDVALPLYQGAMIHQFDFAYKELANSRGREVDIYSMGREAHRPTRYLMARTDFFENGSPNALYRVGFRGVARTTDQHTLLSAVIPVSCLAQIKFRSS